MRLEFVDDLCRNAAVLIDWRCDGGECYRMRFLQESAGEGLVFYIGMAWGRNARFA